MLHVFTFICFVFRQKRPGSPKQQSEKSNSKPPLPVNAAAQFRKGTYHESLDFVLSLCDTSYGLVDIFPVEDRKIALREVYYFFMLCQAYFEFHCCFNNML